MPWPPPMQRVTRPSSTIPALHLVEQLGGDGGAGSADRVAEGDRAAVGVDLVLIEPEVVDHGECLGREGLVELDDLDLLELAPRAFRTRRTAGTGPMPMSLGSTPQLA